MKLDIRFKLDTNQLAHTPDEHLVQLWHIAQANPAPAGDLEACYFAEHVSREIVRRWLASTPPALWSRPGRQVEFAVRLAGEEGA